MKLRGLALVALMVAACLVEPNWPSVKNETSQTVVVVYDQGLGDVNFGELQPGLQMFLRSFRTDECTSGVFTARSIAGQEIARRTEPLCPGTPWVIVDPTT